MDHVERARALVEDDDTLFTLREKLDREKIPYRLARARTVTDDGMTLVTEVAIPLGKKGEESIASFTTGM